ncbi:type III PLP-dependent enzyme [Undibacterium griseum]|uniref:Type III PLP-dependent enzyme n=1 Tax=Undibacterium griseum TaxID=2762295 RepID=A0ABR6YN41_9BURK|nr:type III PLP-dependent enzyme [Undibacterium griseum]MBC3885223.1 type III PLP-dependent enzyme [Undibacterium griseum]
MELRLDAVERHLRTALDNATEPLCAYVYDLEALRRHSETVVAALPEGCELFYAIKANSDLPILRALAPRVAGFEVSSGGELAWVRAHFPDTALIFSGPGKTDAELRLALDSNIEAIHVESQHELQRLAWLSESAGKVAPVLLRVNLSLPGLAATTLMMGGKPTPFGIAADQLPACIDRLQSTPGLRLRGFHFHLLSHQLDAGAHVELIAAYLDQVARWCDTYGLAIDHVNVGGGIGVNYRQPQQQFDLAAFGAALRQLRQSRQNLPRLRFECGRYITAACGYYAMQVLDLKHAFGGDYVVARGGTHHFRTPYAQGHSHPFHILPVERWHYPWPRPELRDATVNVVGQLCTPKDVLAFDAQVYRVRVGDLLVFPYAGAYAWHISHHDFLRHPHPQHSYLPMECANAANE